MGDGAVRVRLLANQLSARVPGGVGRYTQGLVRALAETAPERARIDVAVTRRTPAVADLAVPIRSLWWPDPLLARLWERGLPPWPAWGGVVHAPSLLVPPASRRYRLVVTVHDVVPWTDPDTLTPRGVAFHRRMGARAAREADLIVTPTRVVADQVRAVLDPRSPVVAVHPGVSAHRAPPDAPERRARLGVPASYVLFVGTAEPRKGLDVLVEAMAAPALDGVGLVVAGPAGWGDLDVGALASERGLGGRVVVTGRVSEEDLTALYEGARVLAVPSLREGFGFPVVEALGLGLPVVISDDPALVEVAGGAALVAPVGDAAALAARLGECLVDERAHALAAAGRRRAQDFSWAAAAQQMWQLYESLP